MLHAIPAQYRVDRSLRRTHEPVHEKILELNYRQYEIPVKGQCDILISAFLTFRLTTCTQRSIRCWCR